MKRTDMNETSSKLARNNLATFKGSSTELEKYSSNASDSSFPPVKLAFSRLFKNLFTSAHLHCKLS